MDLRFLEFVALSALLIVLPGPDMALVTRTALLAGRRAASATAFGVGAGILGWGLASLLGVAVLLERSSVAFTGLKLAGAAYLGYLGLRTLIENLRKEGPPATGAHPELGRPASMSDRRAFAQGFVANLFNPKAGVIFVTVVPQFVRPGDSPLRLALMLLAFEVRLLVWLNAYGRLISRAARSRQGARVRVLANRVAGVALIGLGVRVGFEARTA